MKKKRFSRRQNGDGKLLGKNRNQQDETLT